jgi:hypothetical protein
MGFVITPVDMKGAGTLTATDGANTIVALGYSTDLAAYSLDGGASWTAITLPLNRLWQSVKWGNGLFLAIGYATSDYLTSPDGITWTARTLPGGAVARAFADYGNGVWMTVSNSAGGSIHTSPNGFAPWTTYAGVLDSNAWCVRFTGVNFIITSPAHNYVYWTVNGSSVHTVAAPAVAVNSWYNALLKDGVVVLFSGNNGNDSNTVLRSDDHGLSWTAHTLPFYGNIQSGGIVGGDTGGDGFFVAIGHNSFNWAASPDGATWQRLPEPRYRFSYNGMNYSLDFATLSVVDVDNGVGLRAQLRIGDSVDSGDFWTGFHNCGET